MSFQNLNKEELVDVAEFFVVDVEVANPDSGPTKKELLAALASGEEPVTWEQYKEIYQNREVVKEEPVDDILSLEAPARDPEPVDEGDSVLVKYERKNPTWEVVGYVFTKQHPFKSVPAEVAEYLVLKQEGFRLALPSEVSDYYN